MIKPWLWAAGLLVGTAAKAQAQGIDQQINDALAPVARALSAIIFYALPIDGVEVPLVVIWLIAGAVFCTFYFRVLSPAALWHAVRLIKGDFSDPNAQGEISHFRALATALSGTVGVGNIGAVAVLVVLGGPGAVFWMALAGVLGASVKFAECILGVKYRNHYSDGTVSGGPMYYLSKGISEHHHPLLGRFVGGLYAASIVVACLGIGNMFQANQAYAQFANVTGGDAGFMGDKGWLFGIALAGLVAAVVIGGIRSIARVTSKVVPFMAVLYMGGSLTVIGMHIEALPAVFAAIFSQAFNPEGMAGGMLGVMVLGFRRAVFSNEAGLGSAAIAHSAVRTNEPVTEGLVGLLEPIIDTVVICTMTALVILVTVYDPNLHHHGGGLNGVTLTAAAFETVALWSGIPLSLAVVLFAFSTMIAWAYYGLKGWTYFLGESRISHIAFNSIFCFFVFLGCTMELDAILAFSDALIFAMVVPNVLGLYLMAPVVRREFQQYWRRLQNGEIAPTRRK